MNKRGLIRKVAKITHTTQADTEIYLEVFLEVIRTEIAQGGKVQLTGFGTFFQDIINENGREVHNPQTGEMMKVEPTKCPKFRPSKIFKNKVRKS